MQTTQHELTAHHEAGHAVISDRLGLGFTHISIVADPQTHSLGCTGYAPRSDPGTCVTDTLSNRDDGKIMIKAIKHVMKHVAGNAAESLVLKADMLKTESRDYCEAFQCAAAICKSEEEAHAFIRWLFLRTKETLSQWPTWNMVQSLAAKLLERQELPYVEAKQIIDDARQSAVRSRLA